MTFKSIKQALSGKAKILGTAAAAVLAAFGIWYAFSGGSDASYITRPVTRGSLSVEVSANGTLAPMSTVSIGSELSGIVSKVYVDVNDVVKTGDLLIELDTQKLSAQMRQAQASLASAKARLGEAEVELRNVTSKYDRLVKLSKATKGQSPSKLDLDEQKAKLEKAQAEVVSARATVDDAEAALETKKTDLSKAFIRSPIDGMVLSRSVEPGYAVAASLQAVELLEIASDIRRLELKIAVDEADVSVVKPGQKADFTVSAYPNKDFPATLTKVSYGSTVTNNVVTYTTYLDVENEDMLLRPGMTATARIETEHRDDALLVPNMALRFTPKAKTSKSAVDSLVMRPGRGGADKVAKERSNVGAGRQRSVYVLEGGVLRQLTVTVGSSDGSFTEVLSGELKEGDAVVIAQGSAKK